LLDTELKMNIFLPKNFDRQSEAHRYPVIFMNGSHGREFFATLSGIVSHMSKLERMPESIIVTLNDSGHYPKTFTNGAWRRETLGPWGEADKYLQHLETELFPYLEERYRANDHRLIIGVSGSSLFPLYSLINAPDMFDSHMLVAAADMLGMGFEQGKSMVDSLVEHLKVSKKPKGHLYVVNSDDDIFNERVDYRPNFTALREKTKAYQSEDFKVITEVIANERHYDVFIKAMLNWLEQLYPESQWAPKYRDLIAMPGDAMANIDAFYQNLSQQYGFTILPRGDRWNSVNCLSFVSIKLQRDGRIKESIAAAKRWIQYWPNSAEAYAQLAKSLEADKNLPKALAASEKALSLAKLNNDRYLEDYQQALDALKAKL
jgi:predicted alpha/beta superfamily hydrolase